MPIRAAPLFETFRPILEEGREGLPPEAWYDAHTHIGQNDPDGQKGTAAELIAGLDAARQARALVFPMHEPGGYPPANDMVRGEVERRSDRLDWLCRVDPNAPGAVEEARRSLGNGARGIKLHPRSDDFGLHHPVVEDLVALAAEERRPVLFHAGRGIPNLGADAGRLARTHPHARIILAHAGISDLSALGPVAAETPNLLFDTSWWMVSDLLALMATVPPGQILYASDMPYGPGIFASFAFLRCARAIGLSDDAIRAMAGGQLERVLAGEELIDLGPAPGAAALGPRDPLLERIVVMAAGVVVLCFRGGDPIEVVGLARSSAIAPVGHPDAALLDAAYAILGRGLEHVAATGENMAMAPAALVTQILVGTPTVGAPRASV